MLFVSVRAIDGSAASLHRVLDAAVADAPAQ
jgi:hypothetical protein